MEFDELKKVWNGQKQEHVFMFDQSAIRQHVQNRQRQGQSISSVSEWLWVVVNLVSPAFILWTILQPGKFNISMLVLCFWMVLTAAFVLVNRYRRRSGSGRFDRTLSGDLQFALDVARYQVRFSQLGRWNILPVAILSVAGLIESGKPLWIAITVIIFMVIMGYASGWEEGIYKKRLNHLVTLKRKLDEEV